MPSLPSTLTASPSPLPPNLNLEEPEPQWQAQFHQLYIRPLHQLTQQLKECVDQEIEKMQSTDLAKFQISQCELTAQQAIHSLTSILAKSAEAVSQQLDLCQQVLQMESAQLTGLNEIFARGYDFVHHKQFKLQSSRTNQLQAQQNVGSSTNLLNPNQNAKVIFKEDITSSIMNLTGKGTASYSPTSNVSPGTLMESSLSAPLLPTLLSPGKLNLNALDHVGVPLPSKQYQSNMASFALPSTKPLSPSPLAADDVEGETDTMQEMSFESKQMLAKVVFAYTAKESDEIDLVLGEIIEINEWDAGAGWTLGTSVAQSKRGVFPRTYVELLP